MTPDLQNLWNLLSREHRGRANAVTAASLARHFSTKRRTIQEWKEKLVSEYDKPIAAMKDEPKGLFVAVNQEEKDAYDALVTKTINRHWQHLQAFRSAPLEVVEKQEVFTFSATAQEVGL